MSRSHLHNLVRVHGLRFACLFVLAFLPTHAAHAEDCLVQQVSGVSQRYGDEFGIALALSGDRAIVGETSGRGAATVFHHDGRAWREAAVFKSPDWHCLNPFAEAVALHGDTAVVSNFLAWNGESHSGSATVFRFDGTSWFEEVELYGSVRQDRDYFGKSVSVHGEVIVVGAPQVDDFGRDYGAAFAFRRVGTEWLEEDIPLPDDIGWEDRFGNAVAVHGDVIFVGATGAEPSGYVYVFRYDGRAWELEARLSAEHGSTGRFGTDIALGPNVAVIGAPGRWGRSGSAHVFRYDGTDWLEEARLQADDEERDDYFGHAVALSGDTAVVGAPGGERDAEWEGATYVFRRDGLDWVQGDTLLPAPSPRERRFGFSVAVSDASVLVGDPGDSRTLTLGSVGFYGRDTPPLREVSPPGLGVEDGAFFIEKAGDELLMTWEAGPRAVAVYGGTLASLMRDGGHDHAETWIRRETDAAAIFTEPVPPRSYFLVAAVDCEGDLLHGPLGDDSLGRPRPSLDELKE